MRIIDVPSPTEETDSTNGSENIVDLYSIVDDPAASPKPAYGGAPEYDDMSRLYRQIELRLESVVEKLLLSKVDENDNILASMQAVMERIFVTSAMRMAQGNISRAARLLGINRNTLSKKLKIMGTARY